MEVRKAVIPAAGLGTRFLPATKSMPKEMLPLIDRPVIQYVVEEAIASGIDDILIITGRGKRAIEDYFDNSPELEMHLQQHHKGALLKQIQDISAMVDIHYIRQKEPKGLGDAVLRAEKHVGDDPFAILLGDDIIVNDVPCTRQLISVFKKYRCSVLAVEQVPDHKVSSYGIIRGTPVEDGLCTLEDIVEKPPLAEAPSNMGAIGRYVLTPEIFDCIRQTGRGAGNEVQLTDGIRLLKDFQKVYGFSFHGRRYDTGDQVGYVQAIVEFALNNPELRDNLLAHLQSLVKR